MEFRLNHLLSSIYDYFETTFLKELNRHALLNKKFCDTVTNSLGQKSWEKQKSAKLLSESFKKDKKLYFDKLNVKDVADNKLFWRIVKAYFSDKSSNSTKITLVEKDIIITNEKQIANIMKDYFVIITKKLSLKPIISSKDLDLDFSWSYHHKKIKEIYPKIITNSCKFESVTKDNVKHEIRILNVKKFSTFSCIHVTSLNNCVDAYLDYLTSSVNYSFQTSVFPQK